MSNNRNVLDSVLGVLGIVTVAAIAYRAYKSLNSGTETNVISDDALKAIQKPENANKFRRAVDDYHKNGEWNEEKLESIL